MIACGIEMFFGLEMEIDEGRFAINMGISTFAFHLLGSFFWIVWIVTEGRGAFAFSDFCICL